MEIMSRVKKKIYVGWLESFFFFFDSREKIRHLPVSRQQPRLSKLHMVAEKCLFYRRKLKVLRTHVNIRRVELENPGYKLKIQGGFKNRQVGAPGLKTRVMSLPACS